MAVQVVPSGGCACESSSVGTALDGLPGIIIREWTSELVLPCMFVFHVLDSCASSVVKAKLEQGTLVAATPKKRRFSSSAGRPVNVVRLADLAANLPKLGSQFWHESVVWYCRG